MESSPFNIAVRMLIMMLCVAGSAVAQTGDPSHDLADLSLDDLLQLEVTSVSRRAQKVTESPAAITLITNDEIRRSGMTTIPDLLRMVPGLHVANIDANKWAVTARGFNGEFANKLLVMIDGRSVYTPLFAGVFWDVQDVLFEDIDRIEVIRGPGGTLWGANAVNGVINIITKPSSETQGLFVEGGGGSQEQGFGSARWGGALRDDFHYRAYFKGFNRANNDLPSGDQANDAWHQVRTGGRIDWDVTPETSFTLQGDYYDGASDSSLIDNPIVFPMGRPATEDVSGWNVLARWNHEFGEDNEGSLQFYYDRTKRNEYISEELRQRIDIETQHFFQPISWAGITWGAGYRRDWDDFQGLTPIVTLKDCCRKTYIASAFFQGEFDVIEDLFRFTIGSKFEYNSFSKFEYQPSVRFLVTPHEEHMLWAAISRAVRTPDRAETDILITLPEPPDTLRIIEGRHGVDAEELLAYEVGYRAHPLDWLHYDIAAYLNDYDNLVTGEEETIPCVLPFPPGPPPATCIDQTFENKGKAFGWGVETSVTWSHFDWWRVVLNYTYMKLVMDTDNSSTDPAFDDKEGDHAEHQFAILSRVDLPMDFAFDTQLFYVGRVRNQGVDPYFRLDIRLGWKPLEAVEFSLAGQNLTARRHDEYGAGNNVFASEVPRSIYGKVSVRWP
jgi:iron complex outermembrane receptor protein